MRERNELRGLLRKESNDRLVFPSFHPFTKKEPQTNKKILFVDLFFYQAGKVLTERQL